jgi:hypothetical protein
VQLDKDCPQPLPLSAVMDSSYPSEDVEEDFESISRIRQRLSYEDTSSYSSLVQEEEEGEEEEEEKEKESASHNGPSKYKDCSSENDDAIRVNHTNDTLNVADIGFTTFPPSEDVDGYTDIGTYSSTSLAMHADLSPAEDRLLSSIVSTPIKSEGDDKMDELFQLITEHVISISQEVGEMKSRISKLEEANSTNRNAVACCLIS